MVAGTSHTHHGRRARTSTDHDIMKFYVRTDTEKARFFATQGDAHENGKKEEPVWRSAVRIKEVDLPTDKGAILGLLIDGSPSIDALNAMPGRVWTLTARGGLTEIPPESEK